MSKKKNEVRKSGEILQVYFAWLLNHADGLAALRKLAAARTYEEAGRGLLADLDGVLVDPGEEARRDAEGQLQGIFHSLKGLTLLGSVGAADKRKAEEVLAVLFPEGLPVVSTVANAGLVAKDLAKRLEDARALLEGLPAPGEVGWSELLAKAVGACERTFALGHVDSTGGVNPGARVTNAALSFVAGLRSTARNEVRFNPALPRDLEEQLFEKWDLLRSERAAEVKEARKAKPSKKPKADAAAGSGVTATPAATLTPAPATPTPEAPVTPTPTA